MKSFLAISLCALAALALTSDAAFTRTPEDAVVLTTNTTDTSSSEPLKELSRAKRTLGIDENMKKEIEIKTRRGGSIKITKSIAYNDGGGLTMAPALIDSIGANRRKLIYALRGYKYKNCNRRGCDWEAPPAENLEPAGEGNFGGNAEILAPVQAGGQVGGFGGAAAEAAAEASGSAQSLGGSEAGASSQASAQSSAHASSQAEGSAIASSQASAEASSEAGGSALAGSQASAAASSEAEGSAVAGSQASAVASSQAQAGGVASTSNQAPQAVQVGSWEVAPSHVIVGGSGGAWEGAHAVGGWPVGCAGYVNAGCVCSPMMPVLMTPTNSHGLFGRHRLMQNSPFSHLTKRHIRSRIRPLLRSQYPMNSLCASYNPCCGYPK